MLWNWDSSSLLSDYNKRCSNTQTDTYKGNLDTTSSFSTTMRPDTKNSFKSQNDKKRRKNEGKFLKPEILLKGEVKCFKIANEF